jgi:hypothetical protein
VPAESSTMSSATSAPWVERFTPEVVAALPTLEPQHPARTCGCSREADLLTRGRPFGCSARSAASSTTSTLAPPVISTATWRGTERPVRGSPLPRPTRLGDEGPRSEGTA